MVTAGLRWQETRRPEPAHKVGDVLSTRFFFLLTVLLTTASLAGHNLSNATIGGDVEMNQEQNVISIAGVGHFEAGRFLEQ
jgi:hypothetical protein